MDQSPLNSSAQSYSSSNGQPISLEQLQWLLKILSTDDREKVSKKMKECTAEMTLTRGLPTAALLCGSLYYARKKLPVSLRFGSKGWPLYLLAGFGSLTLANMLTFNTCGDRIKPMLSDLFQQYNANNDSSSNSYESLRLANRARNSVDGAAPSNKILLEQRENVPPYSSYNYKTISEDNGTQGDISTNYNNVPVKDLSAFLQADNLSFMSGTPYSLPFFEKTDEDSLSNFNESSETKSKHGDLEFS